MGLSERLDSQFASELEEVANAFEGWAVDLLNSIDSSDESALILTLVPVQRDPGGMRRASSRSRVIPRSMQPFLRRFCAPGL